MGRISKPQKSRRHKKIKDSKRYDDDKFDSIDSHAVNIFNISGANKGKFNAPPKSLDDQGIPRSVQELMKFKKNPGLMKKKRKKKKAYNPSNDNLMNIREKGMTVPLKPVPDFRQGKNESDKRFMFRVERETTAVLQKNDFERKYKVDADAITAPDGTLDRKALSKKKRKSGARLKEKKHQKKEKMKHQSEEKKVKSGFEHLKDEVEFGEVVSAPPSLSAKPRKAVSEGQARKPGKKALLLKDILAKNESSAPAVSRKIGETIKRKDQSLAQQRIMDEARERAISTYRQLKANKPRT